MNKSSSHSSRYPENVVAQTSPDRGGIYPSDIIENRNLCLIVESEIKEIIQEFYGERCEYLPVKIENHRGRLEKKNYFYINPLGSFDCLNKERSDIAYSSEGKVLGVDEYVFHQKKNGVITRYIQGERKRKTVYYKPASCG